MLQIGVPDVAHPGPGRELRCPQQLSEPHVPDAGDDVLIEEHFTDESNLVDGAETLEDASQVEVVGEQVRAERVQRRRIESEDRAVPLRRLPVSAAQREPR